MSNSYSPSNEAVMAFEDVVEIIPQPRERAEYTDEYEEICDNAHRKRGVMVLIKVDEDLTKSRLYAFQYDSGKA